MAEAELNILIRAKDEATKTLQGVQGGIEGMSKQLKMAGIAMVATGGAIVATLGFCAKAAAEEEAGIVKLSMAMRNVGISYDEVKGSLETWIDTQQQKTAVADNEQRESLSKLILATGDLTKAQDLMTLAMDMSRGMGTDLGSATDRLGMALAGNWGMLQRYIPVLAECTTEEEKWAKLREMFAGQAEAYGQTMSGQMELLKNNIGDVKEALGGVIMEAIAPLMAHLKELLPNIKAWIAEHPQLVKMLTLGAAALGLILIPLGTFLIMLPMLSAGIATLTAVSSPWLLIIGAIVVGLMALVAAGVLVWKNWDTICRWASKVRDWFVWLGDAIKEKLLTAFEWLKEHLLWFIAPPLGLFLALITGTGNVGEAFTKLGGMIRDFIRNAVDWLKEKLEGLIKPFKDVHDWISRLISGSGLEELEQRFYDTKNALSALGLSLWEIAPAYAEWITFTSRANRAQKELTDSVTALTASTAAFNMAQAQAAIAAGQPMAMGAPPSTPAEAYEWNVYSDIQAAKHAEKLQQLIAEGAPYGEILKYRTMSWQYVGSPEYAASYMQEAFKATTKEGAIQPIAKHFALWGRMPGTTTWGMPWEDAKEAAKKYLEQFLPGLQHGGVIPFTGLHYLHKGETVLPAEERMLAPVVINLDGRPIAKYVLKIAGKRLTLQKAM